MEINQQTAYEHLTDKEKLVLNFIIVNNRSFKETAAIVDISPYKIKEVYFRAKKYFIIFSEYYDIYDTLFPPTLALDNTFKAYIRQLLTSRKNPGDLKKENEFSLFNNPHYLRSLWMDLFETLPSNGPQGVRLLECLVEFDKWADKRILPKAFQKPSAYDRRRIKIFKKINKEMTSFSDMGYDLIDQLHGDKEGKGYIVGFYDGDYRIIRVKLNKPSFTYLTGLKILLYTNTKSTEELGKLIVDFNMGKQTTYTAAHFWARFRVLAMQATNIEELMGIKKEEFASLSQKDKNFLAKAKEKSTKKPKYHKSDSDLYW